VADERQAARAVRRQRREFKSEALRRGCDQHGIGLRYRPPGQPHFGGIVERLIGTMMQLVHELPGTTFSNTGQRGTYDSDGKAVLTVRELQRGLALARYLPPLPYRTTRTPLRAEIRTSPRSSATASAPRTPA